MLPLTTARYVFFDEMPFKQGLHPFKCLLVHCKDDRAGGVLVQPVDCLDVWVLKIPSQICLEAFCAVGQFIGVLKQLGSGCPEITAWFSGVFEATHLRLQLQQRLLCSNSRMQSRHVVYLQKRAVYREGVLLYYSTVTACQL